MPYRIENIKTETWRRIIADLEAAGFEETYGYDGPDAGLDYNRIELTRRGGGEVVVFEWDNWSEGEIRAAPPMLEALREKYGLTAPVEIL
ncbi:MAG TPA: hypothetical protein VF668_02320 [Pyrinomonadaceae bacterium]|jgi:hypothetical protein